MSPILLVLDIDETLIHATTREGRGTADFEVFGWKVIKRPYLDRFLDYCLTNFDVGIWTSAGEDYAGQIMQQLAPLEGFEFIWSNDRCTRKFDFETYDHYPTKKLKKLLGRGWDKERILAIDDTPSKWEASYGNYLQVNPFTGNSGDDELEKVERYLEILRHEPNLRCIEKRFWKDLING